MSRISTVVLLLVFSLTINLFVSASEAQEELKENKAIYKHDGFNNFMETFSNEGALKPNTESNRDISSPGNREEEEETGIQNSNTQLSHKPLLLESPESKGAVLEIQVKSLRPSASDQPNDGLKRQSGQRKVTSLYEDFVTVLLSPIDTQSHPYRGYMIAAAAFFTVIICCAFGQVLVKWSKNYKIKLNKYYKGVKTQKQQLIQSYINKQGASGYGSIGR